ncbi:MAG: lanthionine synthetase LanC family protein, partial [Planctomycetota bacterium]|nr:lanthionine synthetase LanC family protein [Planctomycetota bacterium]
VKDAGICHGGAGLAHILNRFYQATEEEIFKTTAKYWYEKTVSFQEPGKGIAGFRFLDEEKVEHSEPGLLTGSAGIALALLSAAFPVEPLWDRFLLTSIPDSE